MSNEYLDKCRPLATEMLNKYTPEELPKVDVIMLTVRPGLIGRIASNINGQKVKLGKVVVIMQGYNVQQAKVMKASIKNCEELILIHNDDASVKLGERNNIALSYTTADYIAIMDDDDIYYPNYLVSQLAYLVDHGKPTIVSKINPIARDESKWVIGFIRTKFLEGPGHIGAGGSFVFHRKVIEDVGGFVDVQVGYDSKLMQAAYKLGYELLAGDPFNFIVTRGRREGNTWTIKTPTAIYLNNISLEEVEL